MLLNYGEWEEGFEYMEVDVVYFIIRRMFMEGLRIYQDSQFWVCNYIWSITNLQQWSIAKL